MNFILIYLNIVNNVCFKIWKDFLKIQEIVLKNVYKNVYKKKQCMYKKEMYK